METKTVWTVTLDTNAFKLNKKVSVFDDFQKAKNAFRNTLKKLGENEDIFFDGNANLNSLSKNIFTDDSYTCVSEELQEKTTEIINNFFCGKDISPEDKNQIRTETNEHDEGIIGFSVDSDFDGEWFISESRFDSNLVIKDTEDAITYAACEYDQHEEYLSFRTNAFCLDDEDKTYYCLVREADWEYGAGAYFHLEMRKCIVE